MPATIVSDDILPSLSAIWIGIKRHFGAIPQSPRLFSEFPIAVPATCVPCELS